MFLPKSGRYMKKGHCDICEAKRVLVSHIYINTSRFAVCIPCYINGKIKIQLQDDYYDIC